MSLMLFSMERMLSCYQPRHRLVFTPWNASKPWCKSQGKLKHASITQRTSSNGLKWLGKESYNTANISLNILPPQSISSLSCSCFRDISDRESMATSAVQMSLDLKANIIVVFTMYGEMALLICKYRPIAHIIVVSNEAATIKAMTISHGVISLKVPSF